MSETERPGRTETSGVTDESHRDVKWCIQRITKVC